MKEKTKVKTMQKQKTIQTIKRQVKGITLIALVVTIIVLLILAGVAISLTIGQNGIITRAQTAVIINENASVYEQLQLKIADYQMDNIETGKNEAILDRLKADGHVREINGANILNVTSLMGRNMQTGNGSIETGDVYVIEQRQVTASSVVSDTTEDMDYYLIYYGENNSTSTNLGLAFEGNTKDSLEATGEEWFEFDEEAGAIAIINADDYYINNYNNSIRGGELGLKEIVVPEKYQGKTVTSIGKHYRYSYSTLTMGINVSDVEKIVLPNSVEKLNDGTVNMRDNTYRYYTGAFAGCSSLREIELSQNLQEIGSMAFYNCISLEEIEIPEKVLRIGEAAFGNCKSLVSITIPSSVIKMEKNIFWGCTSLETIYVPFEEGNLPEGWDENWLGDCQTEIIYKK